MPIESLDSKAAREDLAQHDGAVWVDVRTVAEYEAGHPEGAVNVPWAVVDPATGGMTHNPDFLPTMQKHFGKDTRLYMSCQAGVRSMNACEELSNAEYTTLINVEGGYGGKRDPMGNVVVTGYADSGLPVASDASTYEALKDG